MSKFISSADFDDFIVSRYMSEKADGSNFSSVSHDDVYELGHTLSHADSDDLREDLAFLINTHDNEGVFSFLRSLISDNRDEEYVRKQIESGEVK